MMTLNPFVFTENGKLSCIDENSPCLYEQTSTCVIDVAVKRDSSTTFPGQSKYVPWLVCMDNCHLQNVTCHEPIATCHKHVSFCKCDKKVGLSDIDVDNCLKTDIKKLLPQYMTTDKPIQGTPTVHINGNKVKTSTRQSAQLFARRIQL